MEIFDFDGRGDPKFRFGNGLESDENGMWSDKVVAKRFREAFGAEDGTMKTRAPGRVDV